MLKKIGLTPKPFRSRLLVYVPLIAALYMFVWPTAYRLLFQRAASGPLIPKFTNHLVTSNFWETFPSVAVAIPFLFICGFVTVLFPGTEGLLHLRLSLWGIFWSRGQVSRPGRIRVTDACNQCGHCTATCTSNVLVHAEVKEYRMVVDPGCMKCMDCISVCPNDALYFGFGKPTVAVSKSKTIPRELLFDLARRSSRVVRVPWKLPGGARRLCACPISDGAGMRGGDDISRSKNMEIARNKGHLLSPFQSEVFGENPISGLGISGLLDSLDWFDRAQRDGFAIMNMKGTTHFRNSRSLTSWRWRK